MFKKIFLILIILPQFLFFSSCGGEKAKPNILLITIDTLRRDHLSCYGYPRETSPFIDRLAKEGLRFKHAIVSIPTTAPSHASILTSLHPLSHNVTGNAIPLSNKVQTIAEILKQNGYYTIGTVSVPFLSSAYNFSQGFDSFSDKWKKKNGLDNAFERSAQSVDESLFKQVDEFLSDSENNKKPLFIWVHYFDPHSPYREHEGITFKNKLPEREGNTYILNYDKEIRYTDEHIEKLFRFLEKKGIARRMTTCLTGDHGEEFFEHGQTYGHTDFYSETTFVPLIFHGAGIPGNKTVEKYVSLMDIAPTLLGMLNLAFDYPIEGIDLLKESKKIETLRDRKFLIIGNAKYTRSLQMLGYPFSYILNLDSHYKHWFVSRRESIPIPGNLFKPLNKKRIKIQGDRGNTMTIRLPKSLKEGLNYAVLKADVKKNKGLSVSIEMLYHRYTQEVAISTGIKTLTVIYPVTIRDRLAVIIKPAKGTILDNFRYAVISKDELPEELTLKQAIGNKIYEKLKTIRKKKQADEFFNLPGDVEMGKDLAAVKKFKPTILEYRKLIYKAFKFYYKKKNVLLKGSKTRKKLSEEEKKMLESLGYL